MADTVVVKIVAATASNGNRITLVIAPIGSPKCGSTQLLDKSDFTVSSSVLFTSTEYLRMLVASVNFYAEFSTLMPKKEITVRCVL